MGRRRVNFRSLYPLLEELGDKRLTEEVIQQIGDGTFGEEEQNRLIALLAQVEDRQFSLEDIARCFGLSREMVSQICEQRGVNVGRKASSLSLAEAELDYLATPEGIRDVREVMDQVARDPQFWGGGGTLGTLRKWMVLEALGLRVRSRALRTQLWKCLVEREIIREATLVGVILYYGLGIEDPEGFLRELYHRRRETRIKDVCQILNREARQHGLLTTSEKGLGVYMVKAGIEIKSPGSKRPRWLWRR